MSVDLELNGSVCIVTGGTRGIGRAIVDELLDQGARVVAIGSRQETTKHLRDELVRFEASLEVVEQDMRSDESGEKVTQRTMDRFGRIDSIVNNAAAFDYKSDGQIGRMDWRQLFELKLLGYCSLAEAAIPALRATKGAIVNIAGVAGVRASPGTAHVGAINAGIINWSNSLAMILAPQGVRVNTVSPGGTATDRFDVRARIIADQKGIAVETAKQELAADIPVGFPADPREIALVVSMLCSRRLRSVTGAHILVDGGGTLGARRNT
jgi:NAD(P)-dependent dehydrogenase (short-subunit alcohol dehydrogenase family)